MDHTEATAEQLVERYMLDELDDEKAERFEEHYFECAHCANDVRAAVTLMRHGAELPAEETAPANVVPFAARARTWLSTAAAAVIGFVVAVPVFQAPARVPMVSVAHEVGVSAGQSRDAADIETITVGKDEAVVFVIDVVPGVTEYTATVRSTDGKLTLPTRRVRVKPDAFAFSLVATDLPAGTYEVTAPPAATRKFRVIRKEGES